MLRFFRRIRQSLLTQNKFSKYLLYAVGEILLVVIGILIALQVNNWNEGRKERIIEKSILLEFEDNLERNIALIDMAAAEIIEINKTTEAIIDILKDGKSYPDTLVHHFDQLSRSGSYLLQINTNGYESFKNIGFEILSSKSLKKEILSLFEISYPRYIQEVEVVNAVWAGNLNFWQDYFYIRPSQPGWIPLDYSSLSEDKKFFTIVRELWGGRVRVLDQMMMCKAETQRVLHLIRNELERWDS